MNLRQRKVPKDKSQTFAEMTLDALDDGMGKPAVRTLVVSVFQKRQRRSDPMN